jgi:hypothetical protein
MNQATISAVSAHSSLQYRLTVVAPHTGGTSISITGYLIEFKQADASFSSVAACPGTGSFLTDLYCDIDLSTLTSAPFSLVRGAEVVARVSAINSIGTAPASAESSNPTALIVSVPSAPSSSPFRDESTCSKTQIAVNMPVMATAQETGGMTVLSYSLEVDSGSGFSSVIGEGSPSTATTYTLAGLVTGTAVSFRKRV